jgi:hypothetical protein
MPKGISVTHPIPTNRMLCPKYFPLGWVPVIQQAIWKLWWVDGYELGESGEISMIRLMSLACLVPGIGFYTRWSVNTQKVQHILPWCETLSLLKTVWKSSYVKEMNATFAVHNWNRSVFYIFFFFKCFFVFCILVFFIYSRDKVFTWQSQIPSIKIHKEFLKTKYVQL